MEDLARTTRGRHKVGRRTAADHFSRCARQDRGCARNEGEKHGRLRVSASNEFTVCEIGHLGQAHRIGRAADPALDVQARREARSGRLSQSQQGRRTTATGRRGTSSLAGSCAIAQTFYEQHSTTSFVMGPRQLQSMPLPSQAQLPCQTNLHRENVTGASRETNSVRLLAVSAPKRDRNVDTCYQKRRNVSADAAARCRDSRGVEHAGMSERSG